MSHAFELWRVHYDIPVSSRCFSSPLEHDVFHEHVHVMFRMQKSIGTVSYGIQRYDHRIDSHLHESHVYTKLTFTSSIIQVSPSSPTLVTLVSRSVRATVALAARVAP